MPTAYLGLGSNLGDRQRHLDAAVAAVRALPGVRAVMMSGVHETDPVGPQDQGRFLNAAAAVTTTLPARALLDGMLAIEARLGRPPRAEREHWGPREIDLDLLLYGDVVLDEPGLTVPHPRLAERDFVLLPLYDLAPELVHPVTERTVREMLAVLETVGVQA